MGPETGPWSGMGPPGMEMPSMDLPPGMDPSQAAQFARSPLGQAWASGWRGEEDLTGLPPMKKRLRVEVDSRDLPPQLGASLTARYSRRPTKRNWVDRLTKGVLGFEARDLASTKVSLPDPAYSPLARSILQQREAYLAMQEDQYREMQQMRERRSGPPPMGPQRSRGWEEYPGPMEEEMEEGWEGKEEEEGPEDPFEGPWGGPRRGPWGGPRRGPWAGGAV